MDASFTLFGMLPKPTGLLPRRDAIPKGDDISASINGRFVCVDEEHIHSDQRESEGSCEEDRPRVDILSAPNG